MRCIRASHLLRRSTLVPTLTHPAACAAPNQPPFKPEPRSIGPGPQISPRSASYSSWAHPQRRRLSVSATAASEMAAAAPVGEAYCFSELSRGIPSLVDAGAGNGTVIAVETVCKADFDAWAAGQADTMRTWMAATQFTGKEGEVCILPSASGGIDRVALGIEDAADMWAYAALPGKLPPGTYALGTGANGDAAALGWILGTYSFDRYKSAKNNASDRQAGPKALLQWPEGVDRIAITALAEGFFLARDMITTPAEDMGGYPACLPRYSITLCACRSWGRHNAASLLTAPWCTRSPTRHCRRGIGAGKPAWRFLPCHRGR